MWGCWAGCLPGGMVPEAYGLRLTSRPTEAGTALASQLVVGLSKD